MTGSDHLPALIVGIVLTAVFVGSIIGLIIVIGWAVTGIVVAVYTTVAAWMLATGRDGPGGMKAEREL